MVKDAELGLKSVLTRRLARFFRVRDASETLPQAPRKILVVRQDNRIGNLIFILPLLELLRKRFPKAELGLVAGRLYPDLLLQSGLLNRVHCYDQLRFIRFPWRFFLFLREVRACKYDLALDAKRVFSFNNFLLTALSGAARRAGFAHAGYPGIYHYGIPLPGDVVYEPEILAALFRAFEPSYQVPAMRLALSREIRESARAVLSEKGVPPNVRPVAVHPGGRGTKRWPAGRFAEVCAHLLKDPQARVLVLLGPDEKGMASRFPENARLCIIRPGTASDLAAILAHCRLLICNDTGALHTASAVGTPTLSIFLTSSPLRLAPRGKTHFALDGTNGRAVTPDLVAEKAREMMHEND